MDIHDCYILVDDKLVNSPILPRMIEVVLETIKTQYTNVEYINTMLYSGFGYFTIKTADAAMEKIFEYLLNSRTTEVKNSIHDILVATPLKSNKRNIFILTTNNIVTSTNTLELNLYIEVLRRHNVNLFMLNTSPKLEDTRPTSLLKKLANVFILSNN